MAGGSGFIGARVVDLLLDEGAQEIVIAGRAAGSINNPRARYVICDLAQERSVAVIKNLGAFDYVFNLIGVTDQRMPHPNPIELFDANVRTLINLTRGIAWKNIAGAVHVGSSAEYGSHALPHREDMSSDSTNMYGWSKADASLYARIMTKSGFAKWCVARPFFVYGPGRQNGFVFDLIASLTQGKKFTIAGNSTRDPVFVDDVAAGLVRLALCDRAAGEIVNICGGKEVSMMRIAEMVKRKIGKGKIAVTSRARPGDIPRSRGSVKKLKALTGWGPSISLSEGLDTTIKTMKPEISPTMSLRGGFRRSNL